MDGTARIPGDDVDGTEADAADVLEQAQPAAGGPVGSALADRDPIAGEDVDDTRANPADVLEQAEPVVAEGDEDLDEPRADAAGTAQRTAADEG